MSPVSTSLYGEIGGEIHHFKPLLAGDAMFKPPQEGTFIANLPKVYSLKKLLYNFSIITLPSDPFF